MEGRRKAGPGGFDVKWVLVAPGPAYVALGPVDTVLVVLTFHLLPWSPLCLHRPCPCLLAVNVSRDGVGEQIGNTGQLGQPLDWGNIHGKS